MINSLCKRLKPQLSQETRTGELTMQAAQHLYELLMYLKLYLQLFKFPDHIQ